ncbi:MAG TPA: UpxY family transcription antiterminator [Nitrospirota bacterium]|nr:UpxY family transcription antiterminator [Nitrospirota bacterium]
MMTQMNWYALYVKSRHEFVVSNELRRKGIDTFLPSIPKLNQWKDRKKQVEVPLFPSYLFVSIAPESEAFMNVIKTRGAVKFISLVSGHPTPVSPEEIESLKMVLAGGEHVDIYPHVQEGMPVRVRNGVFRGARGILKQKHHGQHVFLVNIELLGRSVAVKMCAEDVEAA